MRSRQKPELPPSTEEVSMTTRVTSHMPIVLGILLVSACLIVPALALAQIPGAEAAPDASRTFGTASEVAHVVSAWSFTQDTGTHAIGTGVGEGTAGDLASCSRESSCRPGPA